jgi:hypothetical protein
MKDMISGFSRREMLARAGGGFGMLAFASMLEAAKNPFSPKVPMQVGGKAKSIIWIFTGEAGWADVGGF